MYHDIGTVYTRVRGVYIFRLCKRSVYGVGISVEILAFCAPMSCVGTKQELTASLLPHPIGMHVHEPFTGVLPVLPEPPSLIWCLALLAAHTEAERRFHHRRGLLALRRGGRAAFTLL